MCAFYMVIGLAQLLCLILHLHELTICCSGIATCQTMTTRLRVSLHLSLQRQ